MDVSIYQMRDAFPRSRAAILYALRNLALTAGTRLGPYEILAPLGAGGMGEVYRARDERLHRDVAIKVLPEAVARDSERLARFEREAHVLAALNHPHIAAIHGVEAGEGIRALVLELVPGETLAERIAAGPIPVDEALAIARQIADALEAAHARGIVHRDLKPANVKITPDGGVKVLDFGLAKALSADGVAPDATSSPTLTAQATQAGVVIGTAAYMSPEQARGRPVDKRSDVWSFGAVLYEMLTGRRCFEGETVSDVLAAVLRQDPDWSRLPPETPGGVPVLLRRCLERDPRRRLRDLGDAWILVDAAAAPGPAPATPRARRGLPLGLAAAAIAVALAAGFLAARRFATPRAAPPGVAVHSVVPLPAGTRLTGWASPVLAISHDGRTLAFVAEKEGERGMLWIYRLDTGEARVVPDSSSAEGPFFSPDGQWLGFATNVSGEAANGTGAVRKFSLATGLTQVVARIPDYYGGSWGDDGSIVVAPSTTEGLWRIPADGGSPDTSLESVVWKGKPARRALQWPQRISPELVLLCEEGDTPWGGAALLDVATRKLEALAPEVSFARYTADGHLLLVRPDRTLMAAPFDLARRRLAGPPVAILKDVANGGNGASALAVSDGGTLVYATGYIRGSGIEQIQIGRVDEKGSLELLPFAADAFGVPMPSPDGRSLAVITFDGSVWIYDLTRQIRSRLPLAGRRAQGLTVVWSPDGSAVAYSASAEGEAGWSVCRQRADGGGPPEQIVAPGEEKYPLAWTPDGRSLVAMQYGKTPGLILASVDRSAPPRRIVDGNVSGASVSPDGHWLAYDYRDTEGWHSVVDRIDGAGPRVLLAAGARGPRWSPDGRFIYCWREDRLLRVPVSTAGRVSPSAPEELFRVPNLRGYSVAPDGKSFYVVVEPPDSGIVRELHLVTNWFTELDRLSPTGTK